MRKTEPDVAGIIFEIVDGGLWVTGRSQITSSDVWQICFRHQKLSPGPKNSLPTRFSTICPKNLRLNF